MSARTLARLAAAGALIAGSVGVVASSQAGAAAPLAPVVDASAQASAGTFHPYSTLVLPDVIFGQMGLSHAEVDGAPRAGGVAGPFYAPAAGLLGLLGLPSVPPALLPYCQSYFPGEPASVSCGGPRQGNGGVTFAFGNGQTDSGGDFLDLSKLFSVASVRFGGAEGQGFSAGGGRTSAQVKPVDGRWTAGASLEMERLVIGDVLTVDAIASSATGALNGESGSGTASRRLVVTGAKVGGQPVDITADGVVVAGQPGMGAEQAKTFQESVDKALEQARLQVRLLPGGDTKVADDGTSVVADSGGVAVAYNAPEPVPPGSGFEMVFGRSQVRMSAYNPDAAAPTTELGSTAGEAGTYSSAGEGGTYSSDTSTNPSPGNSAEPVTPAEPTSSENSPVGNFSSSATGGGELSPGVSSTGGLSDPSAPTGTEASAATASGSAPPPGSDIAAESPPGTYDSSDAVGAAPPAPPESGVALPIARTALSDNDGLGVRHTFLAVGLLALVGPLLVVARRIRLVFGG